MPWNGGSAVWCSGESATSVAPALPGQREIREIDDTDRGGDDRDGAGRDVVPAQDVDQRETRGEPEQGDARAQRGIASLQGSCVEDRADQLVRAAGAPHQDAQTRVDQQPYHRGHTAEQRDRNQEIAGHRECSAIARQRSRVASSGHSGSTRAGRCAASSPRCSCSPYSAARCCLHGHEWLAALRAALPSLPPLFNGWAVLRLAGSRSATGRWGGAGRDLHARPADP